MPGGFKKSVEPHGGGVKGARKGPQQGNTFAKISHRVTKFVWPPTSREFLFKICPEMTRQVSLNPISGVWTALTRLPQQEASALHDVLRALCCLASRSPRVMFDRAEEALGKTVIMEGNISAESGRHLFDPTPQNARL